MFKNHARAATMLRTATADRSCRLRRPRANCSSFPVRIHEMNVERSVRRKKEEARELLLQVTRRRDLART
jgi:hypothetical protein